MLAKEKCVKVARAFRAKHAIEAPDENVIAAVHLMSVHGIDQSAALDQSSRSANDNGIDAWHYDSNKKELFIYQSKLSESKAIAASGFSDLKRGQEWLETAIVDGKVERVPTGNPCLFNLYTRLSAARAELKRIHFILLSPFDANEVEDLEEFQQCEQSIGRSRLNAHVRERNGRLLVGAAAYDLEPGVPSVVKTYSVERIQEARVELRNNAQLDLAYLSLYSLVQLHRERGDILFDKNVRLSLINNKEAKDRLVNPMEATLEAIVRGALSPSIFSFYHIGVTIAATKAIAEEGHLISLEAPSIINGCQTIVIANEFLKKLERQKGGELVDRFKQIKVIAKVVVGTTSDELKEITNCNNRQNPIENWQLFSNEAVHIEIEAALKDIGVFYERQKGKFDSVIKTADNAKHYFATNGTYIRVVDLAQVIALARQNHQWAAKPSEVFINKESHEKCFDKYAVRNPRDIVFSWNLFKALKRGLNNYLEMPAQVNSNAPVVFKKPIVRAHAYSLGLLHFYQHDNRRWAREEFSTSLSKIANMRLVDEVQAFYRSIVTKIRNWYSDESKGLEIEVAKRRMDAYFANLAIELGIDRDGNRPFTERSIDWKEG
jgi:hypothetical protein